MMKIKYTEKDIEQETGIKVKSILKGQLGDNPWDTELGIQIETEEDLTEGQLARLDKVLANHHREGAVPRSMHIAALTAVNTSTKKGTVVRKWMGENYTYTGCYCSAQALAEYQAGRLKLYNNAFGINAPENADSFVLVYFVSENPYDTALEIPVIVDKLVK